MIRYELIVCWSDGTWTNLNYIESEKELTREEAEQKYIADMAELYINPPGISYVGIYNEEVMEKEDED